MKILFDTKKLQKTCNSLMLCLKKWGPECGKRLRQRLDDMHAANCLADTLSLPGRFHPLIGNRTGQWSADLKHPLRLIFEPANDPMPELSDGSPDPRKVNVVKILEVIDTHG